PRPGRGGQLAPCTPPTCIPGMDSGRYARSPGRPEAGDTARRDVSVLDCDTRQRASFAPAVAPCGADAGAAERTRPLGLRRSVVSPRPAYSSRRRAAILTVRRGGRSAAGPRPADRAAARLRLHAARAIRRDDGEPALPGPRGRHRAQPDPGLASPEVHVRDHEPRRTAR